MTNDGKTIQRGHDGAPVLVMAVPLRYMHGHWGLMRMGDYMGALKLILLLLRALDAKTVDSFSRFPQQNKGDWRQ